VLTYTMLFPNAVAPHHGVFVKERLRHLRERWDVPITVVAPTVLTPPFRTLASWEGYRRVPRAETVDGFEVRHPRYPNPPCDAWRARWMAAGVRGALVERARAFGPTVLDVHYGYPDGVAAWRLRGALRAALGRRLPMVVTLRGTDVNLLPERPSVRTQIAAMLAGVDHVVCVADALREVALGLGAPPERTTTLRNGVDLVRFSPGARGRARARTGLPAHARVLVCVGHLVERKGQHLLLEAHARAFGRDPGAPHLVLVGDGPERGALLARARRLGLDERVHLPGAVAPEGLADWYRAADASVLASSREGWPNVVLESLACGTPILATRVWGTPEILTGCAAGRLCEASVEGLAQGLRGLEELDPAAARPWAERHTWDETVDGLHTIFASLQADARHEEPAVR